MKPVFSQLESGTLSDRIAGLIEEAIMSGTIGLGETINIDALARQLKVSHIPIREAIKKLEAVGLIVREPNKSARVIELTREDIADIFAVRAILEGHAVMEATRRLDEASKQRLQSLVDRMRQGAISGDFDRLSAADKEFHQLIWQISGNRFLVQSLSTLLMPYFGYLAAKGYFIRRKEWGYVARTHQEVLDAIASGNGKKGRQILDKDHHRSLKLILES
jgi:DNA-binding GntR family transcriptional regulator